MVEWLERQSFKGHFFPRHQTTEQSGV